VAVLIVLRLAAKLWLAALNRASVRRHLASPPAGAASVMDADTYRRSAAYTLAKSRFGSVEEIADSAILALALFGGLLAPLRGCFDRLGTPGASWTGALFVVASVALLSVPALPFDAWERFRIEAAFGFNRSGAGLWIADRLKGAAVALVLGFPVLWALLVLVRVAGPHWWLWGFALVLGVQLALLVLYPRLILPLFNRLSPLPEGELRTRLLALGERTGYRASSIQVIDGSRRSSHSNAFFTGFGRFRRIVLYDTLVSQLSAQELEAVLAHEIGHYRRGHVPRFLALSAAMLLAGFAAVAWLSRCGAFNAAFGLAPGDLAGTFLLFGLTGGLATFWTTPLMNLLSRRHEYEADAFAREAMGGAAPLRGALRRLTVENLGNLAPHPLYGAFFHSHPTLVERERALGE
jgi:STE24 endopeptidase